MEDDNKFIKKEPLEAGKCIEESKRPVRKTRGQISKEMIDSLYSSEDELSEIVVKKENSSKKTQKKSKSSKLYSCEFCPAIFASNTQLRLHAKIHLGSPSKIHKCEECNVVFSCLNKLTKHKQRVHFQELRCKHCSSTFNQLNSLRLHMRLHSGEKPYTCNECGTKFVQSSHLSIHKRSHTGEKPYQCTVCKISFKQISHLRTHERIHTQDKRYSCTLCGVSFIQKSSLNRHMRIHTGERPYVCDICQAAFCVKNNLNRHMIIHSGIQPYHCDFCGSSFNQAIDLKRHLISHTGIKPFKCDLCDSSFSRKNNLKWHKFTHTGETPFKCELCPASFMKPRDLKKHKMNTHAHPPESHAMPHTCTTCNLIFDNINSFKVHEMQHKGLVPLSCDKCSSLFPDHASLKRHKQQMHASQHECSTCQEKFTSLRSLKRHIQQNHKQSLSIQTNGTSVGQRKLDPQPTAKSTISQVSTTSSPSILENVDSQAQYSIVHQTPQIPQQMQQIPLQVQQGPHDANLQVSAPCIINSPAEPVPQPNEKLVVAGSIPMSNASVVANSVPGLMISNGVSQQIRTGRLATDCQNHSSHFLILNGSNQWQNWCFCEQPQNSPTVANGIASFDYISPSTIRPIETLQPVQVQQQRPNQEMPLQTIQQNFVSFVTPENQVSAASRSQELQVSDISSQNLLQVYNNQGSCDPLAGMILSSNTLQISVDGSKNLSNVVTPTVSEGQILSNGTICWSNSA